MPEFEKIGKVLDSKMKELAETKKRVFVDRNLEHLSALEKIAEEQNSLFIQLGKKVYEKEKIIEQSEYEELIEAIWAKQKLIDAENAKIQGRSCQKCGASLSEGAVFCAKCGEKVTVEIPDDLRKCPQCGTPIKNDAKFCVKCGANISQ